ncbi:uncharacterized protein N0V89_005344 [Didymosphaeria variabile]|uniref:Uncharacterized protein n=1 Tax=Didymosphaeria variabile TaxID=1932322 RepID=A0A9W8XLA4_9PLEO|nr:uncharacterized protein N0V89_005344 [Didymosphaeria variabile]KAJ4353614.1 hypothetical protein N0V89_005344 [Didymosphaeria variabile]
MNVARCIELHNKIVRLGWEAMNQDPQDFHPQTWFEHHGQAAQNARRKLSSDLVAFLQGAYEIPESKQQYGVQNFHYYATALMYPGDDMFALLDGLCSPSWVNQYEQHHGNLDGGGLGRYVRLYWANNLASHPEGLIFDQEKNMAIMSMSIHDSDGLCDSGRVKWHPLEDILAAWLDMIRTGKVKAVGPDTEYRPWELVPYTDYQVNEAVEVFDKLVAAIEAAMPAKEPKESNASASLMNKEALDTAHIPPGFAYDFLTRARRPSFRFIAPGLSLPTASTIADQPFFGVLDTVPEDHRHWFRSSPLLLFRSSLMYNRPSPHPNIYAYDVFGYPFNLPTYPAGLYFHASDQGNNQHSDAVSLVLPFAIGGNGWARKGDGTLFGENVHDELAKSKDEYDELYQTGRQPFIKSHPVRLVQVLRSWVAMVERGDWKVGADGVSNGMNEWKKADSRGGWEKYFITPEW